MLTESLVTYTEQVMIEERKMTEQITRKES